MTCPELLGVAGLVIIVLVLFLTFFGLIDWRSR